MLPMTMARSYSVRLTIGCIANRREGVFFSIDNALYSVAFANDTKTVEPIDMPFDMMSELGLSNNVLGGGDDPQRGRGNLEANVSDKPNTANNCDFG